MLHSQRNAEHCQDVEQFQEYIKCLLDTITLTLFERTSMAISESHHLAFVLKLCCSVLSSPDGVFQVTPKVEANEWKVMIKMALLLHPPQNSSVLHKKNKEASTSESSPRTSRDMTTKRQESTISKKKIVKPNWVTLEKWDALNALEKSHSCFGGLQYHVHSNEHMWKSFIGASNPLDFRFEDDSEFQTLKSEQEVFASERQRARSVTKKKFNASALTLFQRLILVQVFCPEQFSKVVRLFISNEMGHRYLEKPGISINNILKETNNHTPVLFILSGIFSFTIFLCSEISILHLYSIKTCTTENPFYYEHRLACPNNVLTNLVNLSRN